MLSTTTSLRSIKQPLTGFFAIPPVSFLRTTNDRLLPRLERDRHAARTTRLTRGRTATSMARSSSFQRQSDIKAGLLERENSQASGSQGKRLHPFTTQEPVKHAVQSAFDTRLH